MIDERVFIDRIRANPPTGLPVVPSSYPVTSFGDVNRARVLTIGINPSSSEFMTPGGTTLLSDGKKRLVDSSSLGVPADTELDEAEARLVLEGNKNYFNTGNHYKWFDDMEKWVLSPLGYSYFDGTAAHVDVLQWATHPVWSGIVDDVFTPEIVGPDLELLRQIFSGRTYDLVLINGKTVYQFLREHKLFHLDEQEEILIGGKKRWLRTGHVGPSLMVQWSLNVPHYASGTKAREGLREYLAANFRRDDLVRKTDESPSVETEPVGPEAGNSSLRSHHVCPVCDLNTIGGHSRVVCGYCIPRAEMASGQRVTLEINGEEWNILAVDVTAHHQVESSGSSRVLEPGENIWIDGRKCTIVMKDSELFQVWLSESEYNAK